MFRVSPNSSRANVKLLVNSGSTAHCGHGPAGERSGFDHHHRSLRARPLANPAGLGRRRRHSVLLVAPAIWNGYPLFNGIPAAIWRAGMRAISCRAAPRCSASICISARVLVFWINLGIQALATLWILQLTLRVLGMMQPFRLLAISLLLILSTALPWLASMLLTDIFAGLSVLALFILVLHGGKISTIEKMLAVCLHRLCRVDPQRDARRCCSGYAASGWIARPLLRAGFRSPDWLRDGSHHRRRRPDAAVGEFCLVGRTRLDARRLPASPSAA